MKKKYVVPESKLIAINLNESIAISGGVDEVGGMAVIQFTEALDGCRKYYTGLAEVKTQGTNFLDYYDDLMLQVETHGLFEAYFRCFRRQSST
ncbi:MAG: hypothetical protein J6L62_01930 [Clostridia bacterium]|nr:hypothetical protein [Clostridia bacterium]